MTWDSIINALGGTGAVATELSVKAGLVSGWRKRGIPASHWAAVVAFAAECGEPEITLEILAELSARKRTGVLDEAHA